MIARVAAVLARPRVFGLCAALWCVLGAVSVFRATGVITSLLSVVALVYSQLILVAGQAQAEAGQAKADEMLRAMAGARNELIGLDHRPVEEIEAVREELEGSTLR